jgi:uncharacterized protein (DUF58 family)
MYSVKFFYVFVLVVSLFIAGVLLRVSQLLFVVLPLVTYLILSSTGCKTTSSAIERAPLPEKMMAGDYVDVDIAVSLAEVPHMVEVTDAVNTDKDAYFIVKGDHNIPLTYKRVVNRGYVTVGPVTVRLQNFARTVFSEYEYTGTSTVSVLPRVYHVPVKMSSRLTTAFFGPIPSRKAGIGEEFYALRSYVPGDEYRSINWKATARQRTLITNEYEAERVSEAIIVVDASEHTTLGTPKSLLDYELEAASSVALVLLSQGHRVGVFAYSDFFHWISPGTTKRHFIKILDVFTAVQPAGFFRIEYVKKYVTAYTRKGSQIIIMSSLEDPRAVETIQDLYFLGYKVLVISPSPESIEWKEIEHNQINRIARDILLKEREKMVLQLSAVCKAINWNVASPLEDVLQAVEKWSRKQRR